MRTANYVFCCASKSLREETTSHRHHACPSSKRCKPKAKLRPRWERQREAEEWTQTNKNTVRQFLYRGINTKICNTCVNGTKLHSASGGIRFRSRVKNIPRPPRNKVWKGGCPRRALKYYKYLILQVARSIGRYLQCSVWIWNLLSSLRRRSVVVCF